MRKKLKRQFRIPGPVKPSLRVRRAINRYLSNPISHRGEEFGRLLWRTTEKLKTICQTNNDLFMFTSAGTGMMEAALLNCLMPGEKVICVSNGFFGDRYIAIAKTLGQQVVEINYEWGSPVNLEDIKLAIQAHQDTKALIIVHNETSIGGTNDIKSVGELLKGKNILFITDTNSSIGGIDVRVDEWGIDIALTTSQKALMNQTAMGILAVSGKVWWKRQQKNYSPRSYYFDLDNAKRSFATGHTMMTPSVPTVAGWDVAADMILEEGLENVFTRHQQAADIIRRLATDFPLVAPIEMASNTVTAFRWQGTEKSLADFLNKLDKKFNLKIAGGQGRFAGKIFRIGHLGDITSEDAHDIANRVKECYNTIK